MSGIRWVTTVATLLSLTACGGGGADELQLKHYADNPGQTPLGTGKGQVGLNRLALDGGIHALARHGHVDNPGQTSMTDVGQPGFQLDGGIRTIEQHVDNPGQTPMKP